MWLFLTFCLFRQVLFCFEQFDELTLLHLREFDRKKLISAETDIVVDHYKEENFQDSKPGKTEHQSIQSQFPVIIWDMSTKEWFLDLLNWWIDVLDSLPCFANSDNCELSIWTNKWKSNSLKTHKISPSHWWCDCVVQRQSVWPIRRQKIWWPGWGTHSDRESPTSR